MSKSKKILLSLVIAVCVSIATPAVLPFASNITTVEAAKIKLSKKKVTLIKNQSIALEVKNTSKKIKWSTSDKQIATVNSKGKVKAKKAGTATITAKVGNKNYTCSVTVEQPTISQQTLTIEKGKSDTLILNGTRQKVKWSSSNNKIATVNSKGEVTAKKIGTVKITAKVSNKNYTCTVTVKKVSKSDGTVTIGQKNALSKAKSYLNVMAFSYSGLIKQLEFEGFSTADATYAVNNCGANWNEQAVLKAKAYLKIFSFSRTSLIEQLMFEGFTEEQAQYAATAVGY